MKKCILTLLLILSFLLPLQSQERVERSVCNSTVEFVINTNKFIENDDYEVFVTKTIPFIREHAGEIENILLIGSASPEGNAQANIRLANRRADKIYSYISEWVSRGKIIVNNDYQLFLSKTGVDESDYPRLRATYIEIHIKKITTIPKVDTVYQRDTLPPPPPQIDTVYQRDTIYLPPKDKSKIVFGVYNSLSEDLLKRPNIGAEFYFHQLSYFIDGSFSSGTFYGKKYDIDFWHTGFRKYFNDRYDKLYIELYGRTGWYDTDLLSKDDNGVFGVFFGCGVGIGWKFSVCRHWKITPSIRFGFDDFKFNNYYYFDGNGGIDVTFGGYVDGRNPSKDINTDTQTINKNGNVVYLNDKTINKEFFNSSYNMYWFGPSYIGITIQRDFYIH